MFPPELGDRPDRRIRRVGRRGRPLSLVVAVGLLAAFWIGSASVALWGIGAGRTKGPTGALVAVGCWTLVVALLLWRVWRGGRTAIALTARLSTGIGVIYLAGVVAFTVLAVVEPPGGSAWKFVPYFVPALLAGAALLTAGLLLRRREIGQ